MKPAAAVREPLTLTDEILRLRAWRMPDMVAYQQGPEEWWITPLDDTLPLVRLNRTGLELLTSMDGHITVGSLLSRYGQSVCGPDGETGRICLERWSIPNYALCFFGSEPPSGDRHGAKWDLLLQQIREDWSGREGFEGESHLSDFHLHDIAQQEGHFDAIETTVSHLFREPCEALQGYTYGRALARQIRRLGWWSPKPRVIVEIGGGLGYVAREFATEFLPFERQGVRYLCLDLTRPFLSSQLELARQGGWTASASHANAEVLPLHDASVDLVIDNENLADMTPVELSRAEIGAGRGRGALQDEALGWIRRSRLPLAPDMPDPIIFNIGPIRFVSDLWRVLKPGGRAVLIEFGVDSGWPAPVKLPGHTEYEVQYAHLRHVARWLGFEEHYGTLPQFLGIRPDTRLLCTGAAYAIQRFCKAEAKPFSIRAYTEHELATAIDDMLPKLMGCHYHEAVDPAWFGLWDFKVLLLRKPGELPRPTITNAQGYRWYSQH